jgi:hypothetical protein
MVDLEALWIEAPAGSLASARFPQYSPHARGRGSPGLAQPLRGKVAYIPKIGMISASRRR